MHHGLEKRLNPYEIFSGSEMNFTRTIDFHSIFSVTVQSWKPRLCLCCPDQAVNMTEIA